MGMEDIRSRVEAELAEKAAAQRAKQTPPVPNAPSTRERTFPTVVDVAPGTPHPFAHHASQRQFEPAPQQISAEALGGLFQLVNAVSGGNAVPQHVIERLAAPQANVAQLAPAPNRLGLPAAPSRELQTTPLTPPSSEAGVEADTQASRGNVLEAMRGFGRDHKVVTGIGICAASILLAGGVVKAATGASMTEQVSAVASDVIGIGEEKAPSLVLPALDCRTPLQKISLDGMADLIWKAKFATITDLNKAAKDKKYKYPTITKQILPKEPLPAIPFAKTAEEKAQANTKVTRNFKIGFTNDANIMACDPEKNAFRQEGKKVIVNSAEIDLTAVFMTPLDKDMPANVKDSFEYTQNPQLASSDKVYAPVPGEQERLKKVMTSNMAANSVLRNTFKGLVLDSTDTGDCKIQIRTTAQQSIEETLIAAAKKQGVNMDADDIDFENDFRMPGETFRKGKAKALISTQDADIQNPEITCSNVRLAEGVTS